MVIQLFFLMNLKKFLQEEGLKAFLDNERKKKSMLKAGPFKSFSSRAE